MRANDKELAEWLQGKLINPCPKSLARVGRRLAALDKLHEEIKSYVWKTGLDRSLTQQNAKMLEALQELEEDK